MADALLGLARFRWFAFRHSPLSQHRDPAMARPLLNAAAAEPESLLSRMGTTPQGLTAEEVAVRLRAVGPNLVAHDRRQSLFAELVGRARNPLNFLLLSLAAVSYFLGDRRAAAVISVMVVLSVTLAFVQEHRSNNAAARLRAMVHTTVTVLRRGTAIGAEPHEREIPIEEIVSGDVVRLSAGDMIPADLRVLSRDMPCTWVGPPTTTRSAPAMSSSSAPWSGTTATSEAARSPSAIAPAIKCVLPYIDS